MAYSPLMLTINNLIIVVSGLRLAPITIIFNKTRESCAPGFVCVKPCAVKGRMWQMGENVTASCPPARDYFVLR